MNISFCVQTEMSCNFFYSSFITSSSLPSLTYTFPSLVVCQRCLKMTQQFQKESALAFVADNKLLAPFLQDSCEIGRCVRASKIFNQLAYQHQKHPTITSGAIRAWAQGRILCWKKAVFCYYYLLPYDMVIDGFLYPLLYIWEGVVVVSYGWGDQGSTSSGPTWPYLVWFL